MLEGTHIVYLLILFYIPQHSSIIHKEGNNLDTSLRTRPNKKFCDHSTTWNLENSDLTDSNEDGEFYLTPKEVLSCEMFSCDLLPDGVLKINIHIDSVSRDDLVTAIVYEDVLKEEDNVVIQENILTFHSKFYNGSQIVNINAGSIYKKGYIVLLGKASKESIIRIKSISYVSGSSPTSELKDVVPLSNSSQQNIMSNINSLASISKKIPESQTTAKNNIKNKNETDKYSFLFSLSTRLTNMNPYITVPPIILPPIPSLPTPAITMTTPEPSPIATTTPISVTTIITSTDASHAATTTTDITSPPKTITSVTITSPISTTPVIPITRTTAIFSAETSTEMTTTFLAPSTDLITNSLLTTTPEVILPTSTPTITLTTETTTPEITSPPVVTTPEITSPSVVTTPVTILLPVTTTSRTTISPPVTISSVTISSPETTSATTLLPTTIPAITSTTSSSFTTYSTTSPSKTITPITTTLPVISTTSIAVTSSQITKQPSVVTTLPTTAYTSTDSTILINFTTPLELSTIGVSTETALTFSTESTITTSEIITNTEEKNASTLEVSTVTIDFEDRSINEEVFWLPSTIILITVSSFVMLCLIGFIVFKVLIKLR